ncbi:MAG: glycosyltransferase family 2 protein [Verrucomicrobia bacterium]|nr:glycosyltransferase family 2 protein [Verrucomicrobiota bacterium]
MAPSTSSPLISLGLPVYNGENYIHEAIDSVLSQTYSHFELVISDNASTDRTQAICEAYAKKDSRIRYYRNAENRGAAWNFNNTFYLAQGEYFKWAAHDDVLLPRFLELTLKALKDNPDAVLAHTQVGKIENDGVLFEESPEDGLAFDSDDPIKRFKDAVFGLHFFTNIFGLMPSSVLRETSLIGGYASSDVVLLGELALAGKLVEVPDQQFWWRTHKEQSMQKVFHGEDHRAYTYWFNPYRKGKLNFPHWKLLSEYIRCVLSADLTFLQKLKGLKIILTSRTRISGRRQYLLDIIYAFKGKFSRHNN